MSKTKKIIVSTHGSHIFFEAPNGDSLVLAPGKEMEAEITEYLELLELKEMIKIEEPGEITAVVTEVKTAQNSIEKKVESNVNFDGSTGGFVSTRPEKLDTNANKLKDLLAIAAEKGISTEGMQAKAVVSDAIYLHDLKQFCSQNDIIADSFTEVEEYESAIVEFLQKH